MGKVFGLVNAMEDPECERVSRLAFGLFGLLVHVRPSVTLQETPGCNGLGTLACRPS
jgi:hypothetical protein